MLHSCLASTHWPSSMRGPIRSLSSHWHVSLGHWSTQVAPPQQGMDSRAIWNEVGWRTFWAWTVHGVTAKSPEGKRLIVVSGDMCSMRPSLALLHGQSLKDFWKWSRVCSGLAECKNAILSGNNFFFFFHGALMVIFTFLCSFFSLDRQTEIATILSGNLERNVDPIRLPFGQQVFIRTRITKSYIWWMDDPWAALVALAAIIILLAVVGIIVIIFTHSR